MSAYIVNLGKAHRQSLLELINHDNAATIGAPLTVAEFALSDNVKQGDESYNATVTNKSYTADQVVVNYNKLAMGDFISMTEAADDFDWYVPDTWDEAVDVPKAIAAFKAACLRDGVNPDAAFDTIEVSRTFDAPSNHYQLNITVSSFVWKETVSYQMPKHFSEVIDVTDMNGFVFAPIAVDAVVDPVLPIQSN